MDERAFYFLKPEYFSRFYDKGLMGNGFPGHFRPCFFSFTDKDNLMWMIPISSKVTKYRKIYNDKLNKHGFCDTIYFCNVLGYEKAFLIQNICPTTHTYIQGQYLDPTNNQPVKIDGASEKELLSKAKKIVALARRGKRVTFTNILDIEKELK
ncbi:MAG: hypothetical protein EOM02_03335 [Synergistales bacterium]|nr:hypothetical protein [Synergistales bacterium]